MSRKSRRIQLKGELSIWKTFERRCKVVPLKRRQKVFEAESRQPLNVSKRVYPLFSRNPPHYRTPCRVNTYSDLFLKDTRPSRFEMLWSRKLFENRISIQPVETTIYNRNISTLHPQIESKQIFFSLSSSTLSLPRHCFYIYNFSTQTRKVYLRSSRVPTFHVVRDTAVKKSSDKLSTQCNVEQRDASHDFYEDVEQMIPFSIDWLRMLSCN